MSNPFDKRELFVKDYLAAHALHEYEDEAEVQLMAWGMDETYDELGFYDNYDYANILLPKWREKYTSHGDEYDVDVNSGEITMPKGNYTMRRSRIHDLLGTDNLNTAQRSVRLYSRITGVKEPILMQWSYKDWLWLDGCYKLIMGNAPSQSSTESTSEDSGIIDASSQDEESSDTPSSTT